MQRLVRSVVGLCAPLVAVLAMGAAGAAERNISLIPGMDLPGGDYSVVKDTTLDACQAACQGDAICRAFTFNEKAGWCFLKGSASDPVAFAGATSGKVEMSPTPEDIASARIAEIPFPASDLLDAARRYPQELAGSVPPPKGAVYADLVADGDDAVAGGDLAGAMISYEQALVINHNDPGLWLKLAAAALERADENAKRTDGGGNTSDLARIATSAAVNALLLSESVQDRGAALGALAHALELRERWREAIASYRASLALVDNAELQARVDAVVAQHGFRIVSHEVDAEAATPRVCAVFSMPLPAADVDLSGYVVVEGAPQAAVSSEERQICVEGLAHGQRYNVKFRAGLPSADSETLQKDVLLDVYVPDRPPFVAFANNAYVLPAGLGGGLPITSVNAETADIAIYRIGDRSIAIAVRNGVFGGTLDSYSAEDVANQYGEKAWEGKVDLAEAAPNVLSTTAIPVADVIGGLEPGAYVITAKVEGSTQEYWEELATQWFIVTDLGLTEVAGDDGVHAFVRSLTSAQPVGNARVRMIAYNNEVLGEATTNADGEALFAPGLARGTGGKAPQLLVAETDDDYAFLDLSRSAFDLTDRGVEGRPSPGPLDLFATTERGVYRPGETVFVTAMLRDATAKAVTGLPVTIEVQRPDGVIASTEVLNDQGAGGYFDAIPLRAESMRGSWQIRLSVDPKAAPLANLTFLVEDFEPERLSFEVSADEAPIETGAATTVNVEAKYLYGATAPNLSVEADAIIRASRSREGYPGYTFGREDDTFQTAFEPLGTVGVTDENGIASADVFVPETQPTTRPLTAQLVLRLVDSNGRTIERSLSRPVLPTTDQIGLRPQFADPTGLDEGSLAAFDVITVAPDGSLAANTGLSWTLSRIETTYQWYKASDRWRWEAITTSRKVADGTIDTSAEGPVTISAPIRWGEYLLEVQTGGENPTSTSYGFYAGYYYPVAGSNTPDTLQVALDKPSYRIGDTASLRLDPQFAGTALVMVVDNRIISMAAVEVPVEGTTVELPVTAEWGPGAYVMATLYRPSNSAEKRMPARAIGVAYGDVEPGDSRLDVTLETPDVTLPRQAFATRVKIANVAPGETAYVAVAAVDLGILNLTNFKTPDPDGYYFGQRQLGVEIRDLYGQLIDPTQGDPGVLRSGGDEAAARTGTPPATSVLVALHSGIVTVGADGTAEVSFDMPDFNGTVRVMAMAWSASAVGHASADVVVRDPVVVNLSPPRFMRLDDTSRLLVEINNVDGPAGPYRVSLTTDEGFSTDAPETTVDLAAGGRAALSLGLTATAIGDHPLTLLVTGPDNATLAKQLVLGVRAASGPQTSSRTLPLGPGETVTFDAKYFDGMIPQTGSMTLAIGPFARLNVPELLLRLDRYPYGCAEQTSSRALPLLYLNDVAQRLGLGSDGELDQRVKDAIQSILAKQNSAGSFGVWGPFSYTDAWLDAYVTDFLLRAKAEGYEIPELALTMALDSLANQIAYASDFDKGGEAIAYALYDLAKAGRAAIGDLRYYLEARLANFGSPLAQAQLGAALALYGDRTRSATAFKAAIEGLEAPEDRRRYRDDYGSKLRDAAGVLALAAEFKPAGVDLAALTTQLAALRDSVRWTSTQEDAWTLLAASSLARSAASGEVTIDGTPASGTVYRRYDQEHFANAPVVVVNTSNQPTEVTVSVTAIPATPPPKQNEGFGIFRDVFRPDGTPVDLANDPIHQNDRFVVVLTMSAANSGSEQYVVSDPLPGGFEIENPDLVQSNSVRDLSWLSIDTPTHTEARTDQYVAAFRSVPNSTRFSTAYIVRAVTPGTFVFPGAQVEDMYRPELRGNTAAIPIEILPTGNGSPPASAPAPASTPEPAEGAAAAPTSGGEERSSVKQLNK